MTNQVALIRASASPQVGGGHIVRCMALAHELTAQGWVCKFVSGPETATTIPMVSEYEIITIDESDPTREPEAIRQQYGQDVPVVIIDHYQRGYKFETECRKWADKIVVLNDVPSDAHNADLLLDQSGGRTPTEYSGLIPNSCELILGPGYSLLRHQFSSFGPVDFKEKLIHPRIFISMGATDGNNLTATAMDAVNNTLPGSNVDVMLSAKAPHLPEIQAKCLENALTRLHVDSADPALFMAHATFAIGTAGINLWERCALGIPSILLIAAENQRDNALHVVAEGGGVLIGCNNGLSINTRELEDTIVKMWRDKVNLINMSNVAQRICDGMGAKRVADKISTVAGF